MTINKKAMLAVADVIEFNSRFDMSHVSRYEPKHAIARFGSSWQTPTVDSCLLWEDCGTVGCVWGWTNAWANHDKDDRQAAADELGLNAPQTQRLFYAEGDSIWAEVADEYGWELNDDNDWDEGGLANWEQITADQAADVLRRIAAPKNSPRKLTL